MAKAHILVSSGFILPDNKWFTPIEKSNSYRIQLLSPENGVDSDPTLAELINASAIYSSRVCNEAFLAYQHKPTFEHYMGLVDLFCDVFAGEDLINFYEIQSRNTYLSATGFSLLTDFISNRIYRTYAQYAVAPSFFRMDRKNNYQVLEQRKVILNDVKRNYPPSASSVLLGRLADVTEHRDAFAALFKYMLTDSNRGNAYA